jgi:hypothetical protein
VEVLANGFRCLLGIAKKKMKDIEKLSLR